MTENPWKILKTELTIHFKNKSNEKLLGVNEGKVL